MKEIHLTQGKVALVDDEDYERVMQFKWYATHNSRSKYYAARNVWGKPKVYLHRFILDAPGGILVDHKDRDSLNCQRYNMRFCNKAGNQRNQGIRHTSSSGFKGVCWRPREQKWSAQICTGGNFISLGYFDNAEDAALAYDAKALELFGEFACTNFITLEQT